MMEEEELKVFAQYQSDLKIDKQTNDTALALFKEFKISRKIGSIVS